MDLIINELDQWADDQSLFGRMNDPTGAAAVTGQCGDDMAFYLFIRDDVIEDALYYTEKGCRNTCACGAFVARNVKGVLIKDAMRLSARDVVDGVRDLAQSHRHCALLTMITFYKALGDYALKP